MSKLILILVSLLVITSLVLAGCGGGSVAAPPTSTTPSTTPTTTLPPTITQTPTPSPSITPTQTPTQTPLPAKFEVISLDIKPAEISVGDTANITATIKNTGGSEGTYKAILTVNGTSVDTKFATIQPNDSEEVTFSLSKDTPGTYTIAVGDKNTTLTVKQHLITKQIELKYDDGTARDSISTVSPSFGGHIVDYSPPANPFTVTKIRIAGLLSSYATGITGKTFDLQILDKNLTVLYSATYPYTKFPYDTIAWVEFQIPNVVVADKFYVHLYTDSPYPGLHIGADDSVINEHSDVTIRTNNTISILEKWPYSSTNWFGNKSKVNWMIRVTGTYLAPLK